MVVQLCPKFFKGRRGNAHSDPAGDVLSVPVLAHEIFGLFYCFFSFLNCHSFIEDDSITPSLRQKFLDCLFNTYQELEWSFMKKIYELHKAFAFRTLWEGNNLLESYRRLARDSAMSIGRLNGVVYLTKVLRRLQELKDKANKCFTYNRYTTGIHKWNFNIKNDKMVS